MDPDFWRRKWEQNEIGFHEGAANAMLAAHFDRLSLRPGARVLIPLCGKSHDIWWLRARGFDVVGAELHPQAVEALFAERGVTPATIDEGRFRRFSAEGVEILAGDIFDLTAADIGPVDAIYDRAALVAMPPAMRARYAAQLLALGRGAPQLLVSLIYDQNAAAGPPFSVDEATIAQVYGGAYRIDLLESIAAPVKGAPGCEAAWLLRPAAA